MPQKNHFPVVYRGDGARCWLTPRGLMPIMTGADPNSPLGFPLDPATVSGTVVSLDILMNEPTRILRDIASMAYQGFFIDQVFSPGGGIDGGAILFERPNTIATDLFATRDYKEVAPGDEFPLLTFVRGVPMLAFPRKIGAKFYILREERKRNRTDLLARYITQSANTLKRRLENMGLAELDAVATATSRFMTGTSWSGYAGTALISRTGTTGPGSDLLAARTFVELEQRGHNLNSIVMHPNEAQAIMQAYPGMSVDAFMANHGIRNTYISPRQTAGRVRLWESGQVGQWRNEFPLMQETEEEGVADGGTQRTWFQWSISPSYFVTDQYSYLEIRGVA